MGSKGEEECVNPRPRSGGAALFVSLHKKKARDVHSVTLLFIFLLAPRITKSSQNKQFSDSENR